MHYLLLLLALFAASVSADPCLYDYGCINGFYCKYEDGKSAANGDVGVCFMSGWLIGIIVFIVLCPVASIAGYCFYWKK